MRIDNNIMMYFGDVDAQNGEMKDIGMKNAII